MDDRPNAPPEPAPARLGAECRSRVGRGSRVRVLPAVMLAAAALGLPARAVNITIGSFDNSRSSSPFATTTTLLGYTQLRTLLTDPANFGPAGIVPCPVVIAPGTPRLTDNYLSDKDLFFTSVFTEPLSESEEDAIQRFIGRGGCVIMDTDSGFHENEAARSMLLALSINAGVGPELVCTNSPTGGTISPTPSPATDGPFGDITGGSFGTSQQPSVIPDGRDQLVVVCNNGTRAARAVLPHDTLFSGSGLVMYGGDPAGSDAFMLPGEFLYNPNNEILYMNAIAACCGPAPICPLPKAYWRSHPEAWPVTELSIGCQTYSKEELVTLLAKRARGQVGLSLVHQLIAEKLNVANGSDPQPITPASDRADTLLCKQGGRLPSSAGSDPLLTRESMIQATAKLRSYNLLELTADCRLPCGPPPGRPPAGRNPEGQ